MPVRPPIPELLKFLSAYDKPVIALVCAAQEGPHGGLAYKCGDGAVR
jgi:hypothetical protein